MSRFWHLRWLIPFIFTAYIIYEAIFSWQLITAATNFVSRTRNFGVLLPAGRVERAGGGLKLMAEPVYFDVKLPLRVAAVELEIATTAESAPLKIGVRQGGGWDYYFPDYTELNSLSAKNYRISISEFKYVEANHAQRFLISAPGLEPGRITIIGAQVKIRRHNFDLYQSVGHLTTKLTELWFK